MLHEAEQVFNDGRRRVRNIPLSEKLLPGEDAATGARRGILEELGSAITDAEAIEVIGEVHTTSEWRASQSYPGLHTKVLAWIQTCVC